MGETELPQKLRLRELVVDGKGSTPWAGKSRTAASGKRARRKARASNLLIINDDELHVVPLVLSSCPRQHAVLLLYVTTV